MALQTQSANPYSIGIAHEGYAEYGNGWHNDKMDKASAARVRELVRATVNAGNTNRLDR